MFGRLPIALAQSKQLTETKKLDKATTMFTISLKKKKKASPKQ